MELNSIWKLEVKNGDEIGRVYNLTNLSKNYNSSTLTIGWLNPQNPFLNHISLAEEFTQYISQYHASLELNSHNNHWYIRDGQYRKKGGKTGWYPSTNGILLNSVFLDNSPHPLNPGDIIMIGNTSLKVIVE